jgi:hypothetical protein
MWSDRLKAKEAEYTQHAIDELSSVSWATPLLSRLQSAGGLKSENMPIMFEVRFAYELHRAGVSAIYEYQAGVGNSRVEFKTETSPPWLIELVSVRTSDAAKRAIRQTGLIYEQLLAPTPDDPARSEEAEMITAEQKIGEKVFVDGKPTKFPPISDSLHLILTDIRGYLDEGGDTFDYRQMAYGARGIPAEYSWMIHYWEIEPGKTQPIKGLFETDNPLRSARYIQERIHFLGFVREREFREGEICEVAYYPANPHIFEDQDSARDAFRKYPLAQLKEAN